MNIHCAADERFGVNSYVIDENGHCFLIDPVLADDVDFLDQHFLNYIRGWVIKKSIFSTYCSTAKLDFPKGYQYVLMRKGE